MDEKFWLAICDREAGDGNKGIHTHVLDCCLQVATTMRTKNGVWLFPVFLLSPGRFVSEITKFRQLD